MSIGVIIGRHIPKRAGGDRGPFVPKKAPMTGTTVYESLGMLWAAPVSDDWKAQRDFFHFEMTDMRFKTDWSYGGAQATPLDRFYAGILSDDDDRREAAELGWERAKELKASRKAVARKATNPSPVPHLNKRIVRREGLHALSALAEMAAASPLREAESSRSFPARLEGVEGVAKITLGLCRDRQSAAAWTANRLGKTPKITTPNLALLGYGPTECLTALIDKAWLCSTASLSSVVGATFGTVGDAALAKRQIAVEVAFEKDGEVLLRQLVSAKVRVRGRRIGGRS